MTQLWERLFIGGLADVEQLAAKNPQPITTVISLSQVAIEPRRATINYLSLPVEDDKPVSALTFDRSLDALTENIRWGTVLLNCSQGVSRAPSIAAAYMDAVGYKSIDASLDEIRRVRSLIQPSTVLVNSLKEHLR